MQVDIMNLRMNKYQTMKYVTNIFIDIFIVIAILKNESVFLLLFIKLNLLYLIFKIIKKYL